MFQFWIQPADVDEPDTDYTLALERCTWLNRAGVQGSSVAVLHVFPDISDQSFRMDIDIVESSVADSVALSAGHPYDGGIMFANNGRGNTLVERSRIERSGNFDPAVSQTRSPAVCLVSLTR